LEEIGRSYEGRPIPLLTITDPTVALADKSVILVTGGTHGSEETGRAATLALARWLLGGPGSKHLRTQVVLIAPCVNPDGAEHNAYHNAQDVNLNRCYRIGRDPEPPEAQAIYGVARQWVPDAYVDVHGLAGGAIGDSEYVYIVRDGSAMPMIALAAAREMDAAAEGIGFPQRFCRLVRIDLDKPERLSAKLLAEYNTFALGLEITENYYPLEDSIRSGLIRLQTLLAIGERTQWYQPYRGYPCDIVAGDPVGALMPFGRDYQQRRLNRRKLVGMIVEGSLTNVHRLAGDAGHVATVRVDMSSKPSEPPEGFVLQARLDPRVDIRRVRFAGRELELSEVGGYRILRGDGHLTVRADIEQPLCVGQNELCIEYAAPYRPHTA
jgi:hypothetical protein